MNNNNIDNENNKIILVSDKYHFVHIVFFMSGLSCLIPWNFYITSFGVLFNKYNFIVFFTKNG